MYHHINGGEKQVNGHSYDNNDDDDDSTRDKEYLHTSGGVDETVGEDQNLFQSLIMDEDEEETEDRK